jgi:outer membrane protein assembly factor BamA
VPTLLLVLGLLAGQTASSPQPRETIVAIQIHGNTATSDTEIKRIAAVDVGTPMEPTTIAAVTARLRAAKRFESVQVLKRYASIADLTQILLVIVVDEGPVKIEMTGDVSQPTRVVRERRIGPMVMPVLTAEDGYGLTYGARLAWPGVAGKQSRIGVPLTWGGDKRAGVELDKTFTHAPIDRIIGGASISRRTNPFYDEDDDRLRVLVRGERAAGRWVRAGAIAGWQRVSFFDRTDRFGHVGADLTLDTRLDPFLPRNAVYARAAWEHIAGAERIDLDARGYVGVVGQTVLAVRGARSDANQTLPPYLKPLLGGMNNLRGFRAGTAAGDTLVTTSAELFVPLTPAIVSVGKTGLSAFIDAGTAYDKGQRLSDQEWKRGIGGSVWFSAAFLRLTIAVAHGRGSSTRVHVGGSLSF